MTTRLWFCLALCTCLPVGVSAQVNKCTIDGKVVYQQEACGKGGSSGSELKMVIPSTDQSYPSTYGLEKLQRNYDKAKKEHDALVVKHCAGMAIESPSIGMSEADLQCIAKYRSPEKVNVTTTEAGESKQYIYKDHSRTTYLYFRSGKLTSIQAEQ